MHAPGQRRDRQRAGRQQGQRDRDQQRQCHAGGGYGHGAPGFTRHQQQEFALDLGWKKITEETLRRFQCFRLEQGPGPEFGHHQRRCQQHQRGAEPEQPRQPGGIAVLRQHGTGSVQSGT